MGKIGAQMVTTLTHDIHGAPVAAYEKGKEQVLAHRQLAAEQRNRAAQAIYHAVRHLVIFILPTVVSDYGGMDAVRARAVAVVANASNEDIASMITEKVARAYAASKTQELVVRDVTEIITDDALIAFVVQIKGAEIAQLMREVLSGIAGDERAVSSDGARRASTRNEPRTTPEVA